MSTGYVFSPPSVRASYKIAYSIKKRHLQSRMVSFFESGHTSCPIVKNLGIKKVNTTVPLSHLRDKKAPTIKHNYGMRYKRIFRILAFWLMITVTRDILYTDQNS